MILLTIWAGSAQTLLVTAGGAVAQLGTDVVFLSLRLGAISLEQGNDFALKLFNIETADSLEEL